jgi:hypothetical protein
MINDVLNKFFKSAKIITYKPKDIMMKKGKVAVDEINFSMYLPLPSFNLLSNPQDRMVVDDLYDSAIDYIETTWKEEVLSFALKYPAKIGPINLRNGKNLEKKIAIPICFSKKAGPDFV